MLTLTLLSHKGGSGKSTLALGLGVECATTRGATCIIDIDPQGTAVAWSDQRGEDNDPVVTATQPNRLGVIQNTCKDNGVARLIIDTPAGATESALAAAALADVIVIPCRPTGPDMAAMPRTARIAELAGRPAIFVINQGESRGDHNERAREALAILGKQHRIPTCPVTVMRRIAHVRAYENGQTAREAYPGSKAAAELEALEKWITDHHAETEK